MSKDKELQGSDDAVEFDEAELITEDETCSIEELEEAIQGFIEGDLTLAQLEGLTAEDLYGIADMGYDLLSEGKLDDAQTIFEGLYVYNPFDAYFHAALGSVYHRKGMLEEALNHYESAVQLYPEDIHSWTNAAEAMIERSAQLAKDGQGEQAQDLFAEAVGALQAAISLDPEGENAAGLRARALVAATASIAEAAQAS